MRNWLNRKIRDTLLRQQIVVCEQIEDLASRIQPQLEGFLEQAPEHPGVLKYIEIVHEADRQAFWWKLQAERGNIAPRDTMEMLRNKEFHLKGILSKL
jgi:hypothetical protein